MILCCGQVVTELFCSSEVPRQPRPTEGSCPRQVTSFSFPHLRSREMSPELAQPIDKVTERTCSRARVQAIPHSEHFAAAMLEPRPRSQGYPVSLGLSRLPQAGDFCFPPRSCSPVSML